MSSSLYKLYFPNTVYPSPTIKFSPWANELLPIA
nr:MAG TPA: hypothetical protein [Bacteriophage sp.]